MNELVSNGRMGGSCLVGAYPATLHEFPSTGANELDEVRSFRIEYARVGPPTFKVVNLDPNEFSPIRVSQGLNRTAYDESDLILIILLIKKWSRWLET